MKLYRIKKSKIDKSTNRHMKWSIIDGKTLKRPNQRNSTKTDIKRPNRRKSTKIDRSDYINKNRPNPR